jgi:hypothetical protein
MEMRSICGVACREQVTKDVKAQDPQTKEIRIEPQLLLRNKLTATVEEITETPQEARPAATIR